MEVVMEEGTASKTDLEAVKLKSHFGDRSKDRNMLKAILSDALM